MGTEQTAHKLSSVYCFPSFPWWGNVDARPFPHLIIRFLRLKTNEPTSQATLLLRDKRGKREHSPESTT